MKEKISETAELPFSEFPQNARSFINSMNEIDTLLEQYKHPSRVSEKDEEKIFQILVATDGLRFLAWCFEHEVDVKERTEQLALAGLSNQEQQGVMNFLKSHKAWSDFCLRSFRWSEGYYNEFTKLTFRHYIIAKNRRVATYLRLHSFDKVLECQTEYRALAAQVSSLLSAMEAGLRYADNIDPSLSKTLATDEYVSGLRDTAAKLAAEIEARQKGRAPTKK